PEARATVEALLAKLAAPGLCNPDDDTPMVDDEPSEDALRRDLRSDPQRNHDALLAGFRALLASGKLGRHNGLPASITVVPVMRCWARCVAHQTRRPVELRTWPGWCGLDRRRKSQDSARQPPG